MNEVELLRAVLDATTDAVCLVDHGRKVKLSNPANDRVFGRIGVLNGDNKKDDTYLLTDDVIRQAATDYEDAEQVACRMIDWLGSQECHWDTVRQHDGHIFQRRCIPIPNHGHLLITQDVTAHVQEKARYQRCCRSTMRAC